MLHRVGLRMGALIEQISIQSSDRDEWENKHRRNKKLAREASNQPESSKALSLRGTHQFPIHFADFVEFSFA